MYLFLSFQTELQKIRLLVKGAFSNELERKKSLKIISKPAKINSKKEANDPMRGPYNVSSEGATAS